MLALLERRVEPDDVATEHVSVTIGASLLPEFRGMLLEGFGLVE